MNVNGHLAAIRFGYGLRLGEPPPADPIAWLDDQLGAEDPLPPSPDLRARLHAREADRTPAGRMPRGSGRRTSSSRIAATRAVARRHSATTTG